MKAARLAQAAPKEPPTSPAVTAVSPEIMCITVLFPDPLGPNRPNSSPGTNTQELLMVINIHNTLSPVCQAMPKSSVGERGIH